MAVFLVITILILTLSVTPICLTIKAGVDVLGNRGYIRLYLFFIPVYKTEFHVESPDVRHRNLVLEHKKKRTEIHLNADKNDGKSVRNLIKKTPIVSAVRVRNLTLDAHIGKSDDPLFTTFMLGAIRTVFYSIAAFLKSREDITVESTFLPFYSRDVLKADLFAVVSLSLMNVVVSIAQGLIRSISRPHGKKAVVAKGSVKA